MKGAKPEVTDTQKNKEHFEAMKKSVPEDRDMKFGIEGRVDVLFV